MELLQLQYFLEVARREHMTEAAQSLHVTQSSLSKTIQRLEEDLDVQLFDRTNRRLRLNEFGRLFLPRAESVLFELEQGRRELRDLAGGKPHMLKLAVTAASVLPPILSEFRKRMPEVQFHAERLTKTEMMERLLRGEIDYALSSPFAEERLVCQVVHVDPIVAAIPDSHPLASRESISLRELRGERLVGAKKGYGIRDLVERVAEAYDFMPSYVYEGDELSRLIPLVEADVGIALIPATAREERKGVHYVSLEEPELVRKIALIRNENHYFSRSEETFRDVVVEYFAGK
ncbi:LysR family transcriptional regulator [Saccharibacillus sp. O16]|nr:LysR family transcriptional regulator [Saccharibacillus sp. O16]